MKGEAKTHSAGEIAGRLKRLSRAPHVVVSLAAAGLAILIVLWAGLQHDPLIINQVFLVYLLSLPILVALGLRVMSRRDRSWPRAAFQWGASSVGVVIIALAIYELGLSLVLSHLRRVKAEQAEYNYPHFFLAKYKHQPSKLRAGMPAIDETVYDLNGRPLRLSELWVKRPIVMEFGAIT